MTAIDLLCDDAASARRVIETTKPRMTRQEYLEFQRGLDATELFQPEKVGSAD